MVISYTKNVGRYLILAHVDPNYYILYNIGKPKPRVQWYSADGTVTPSLNIGIIDLTEGHSFGNNNEDQVITTKKLVINQLNRSHANSTYTCVARNDDNAIESNLRMTVLINMYCK